MNGGLFRCLASRGVAKGMASLRGQPQPATATPAVATGERACKPLNSMAGGARHLRHRPEWGRCRLFIPQPFLDPYMRPRARRGWLPRSARETDAAMFSVLPSVVPHVYRPPLFGMGWSSCHAWPPLGTHQQSHGSPCVFELGPPTLRPQILTPRMIFPAYSPCQPWIRPAMQCPPMPFPPSAPCVCSFM